MTHEYELQILAALQEDSRMPLKAKQLAKRLGVDDESYGTFRKAMKRLVKSGKPKKANAIPTIARSPERGSTVVGTFRRTTVGTGYVRPKPISPGLPPAGEIRIRRGRELDAATGDEVLVRLTKKSTHNGDPAGDVIEVLERATRTFVGEYFERDGQGLVRIDGTIFSHSVAVGDPGAKGAKPKDKVVVEMVRFPSADDRGEAVVVEVLGPRDKPGVDMLTVIRGLGLPEEFSPEVLAEARAVVDRFRETDLGDRTDFTGDTVITIDPVDARDFDDAVGVEIDPETGHWLLTVHIADVGHFAPPGSKLDTEARHRATSIYLPQRVIPMFPELISNGVASLQEGKLRYVKSVRIEYTPSLQIASTEFFNGAIRTAKRFSYEQVQEIFDADTKPTDAVGRLLKRLRELAGRLRAKRLKRGTLELEMPEAKLEFDDDGRVCGAHFATHDESHRVVEECMLAANEAVARHFGERKIFFLRRVHPSPNPEKLKEFAEFAAVLGYPLRHHEDRFELQRVLRETADKPERAALHFSLLRSLKQATYSPTPEPHYALAMTDYCHFTSPIRRYPDLTVHRLLGRWVERKKVSSDEGELHLLGDHCSKRERRAELAERELVKLKLLGYMAGKVGESFAAVITGVAEYGFFAQCERFPAEGLVHISSLTDDYYRYDDSHRQLVGGLTERRFRLGDQITVVVARVDPVKRQLDFRVGADASPKANAKTDRKPKKTGKPKTKARRRRK
jgi:ribonuclease R